MGNTLNFRSIADITRSIAQVTGVASGQIDAFIPQLLETPKGEFAHRSYWEAFQNRFGATAEISNTVCFHGTRCVEGSTFSDGLLPNSDSIDLLWKLIWETCSDHLDASSALELRSDYESSEHSRRLGGYFDRLESLKPRERGPWGKVVRDEWLIKGRNGNHYFERGPEIVQIILNHYSGGSDLNKIFQDATRPCLVHFVADRRDPYDIGHGLAFLRDSRFCSPPHRFETFYGIHSSEGIEVQPTSIMEVEWFHHT